MEKIVIRGAREHNLKGVNLEIPRNEIVAFDPPSLVAWTSWPPLDDGETEEHQIEVRWRFAITPTDAGCELEHTFEVDPPRAGAAEFAAFIDRTDRVNTVRTGMLGTLANVKREAEASNST